MKKPRIAKSATTIDASAVMKMLFDLEPDMRALMGMLVAFRTLGMASDAVHPSAISVLAQFGDEAIERLEANWNAALDKVRGQLEAE